MRPSKSASQIKLLLFYTQTPSVVFWLGWPETLEQVSTHFLFSYIVRVNHPLGMKHHFYHYFMKNLPSLQKICRTMRVKHIRSHKRISASHLQESSHYNSKHELKLSDSNTFYSTFHETAARKQYSKDEWDEFTKQSTKKALESLVWSPDFNRWAVANADRLALLPKKDTKPKRKSWFSWSWSVSYGKC